MLHVLLFASLVISCRCLKPYEPISVTAFRNTMYSKLFPTCGVSQPDLKQSFQIRREPCQGISYNAIMNRTVPYFTSEEGNFYVHSVKFQFPGSYAEKGRSVVLFKSFIERKEWHVISEVYSLPSLDLEEDARRNAIYAEYLPVNVPDVRAEEVRLQGTVSFSIAWVLELLRKERPKFVRKEENGPVKTKLYLGLPIVLDGQV